LPPPPAAAAAAAAAASVGVDERADGGAAHTTVTAPIYIQKICIHRETVATQKHSIVSIHINKTKATTKSIISN